MKMIRSSQAAILCTDLSKIQLFPVRIVKIYRSVLQNLFERKFGKSGKKMENLFIFFLSISLFRETELFKTTLFVDINLNDTEGT